MAMIKRMPSDLMIVLLWTILSFIFVITPILDNSIIRTILGIPAILFIPGYVLVSVLFPKKTDLDSIERIALSLGMSIAIVPLIGLFLNFTIGIKLIPVLIAMNIYAIILIFFASYRREKLSEDEKFSVSFGKIFGEITSGIKGPKSRIDNILTGILIFTLIIAIGMIFFVITTPKVGEKFTEFYVLNAYGKADNYQTNLKIDQPVAYLIGIVDHEYMPVDYTVNVVLDQKVLAYKEIRLNHNDTWEDKITVVPDKEGTNMKLEFWLFKDKNFTEPYRELHLRINSKR